MVGRKDACADHKGGRRETGTRSLSGDRWRPGPGHLRFDGSSVVRPSDVAGLPGWRQYFPHLLGNDGKLTWRKRVTTAPHSLNQIPVRHPSAVGCGRDSLLWRIS